MEFTESVVRVGADVIERIVRVLSGRIRADQHLAAVVDQRRLDRFFPDFHHGAIDLVVAVFGEGGLVDDHTSVAPAAAGDLVPQGQKSN